MFTASVQATKRHNGPGTRSVFDFGIGDFLAEQDTIEAAMAEGLRWQRECVAQGYEAGWIMVENDDRDVIAEAKQGDVDLALGGWPLSWDTVTPVDWDAVLAPAASVPSTDDIPF